MFLGTLNGEIHLVILDLEFLKVRIENLWLKIFKVSGSESNENFYCVKHLDFFADQTNSNLGSKNYFPILSIREK